MAAEERCALAETEIREEVSTEMASLLHDMEANYKVCTRSHLCASALHVLTSCQKPAAHAKRYCSDDVQWHAYQSGMEFAGFVRPGAVIWMMVAELVMLGADLCTAVLLLSPVCLSAYEWRQDGGRR